MGKIEENIERILELMELKNNEIEEDNKVLDEESEVNEEGEGTSTETETKSTGAGTANVWSSGVSRGPANQVANTKWSDTVGAQLKRGKANMLK